MNHLNLPEYSPRVRHEGERTEIFDPLRNRFVALTPEEWVRQHFVNYLVNHCGYKAAMIANEVALQAACKTIRADSVVYSHQLVPRMIIEYKAPTIPITEAVFHQALAYNSLLHVEFLAMSNGLKHIYCHINYATGSFHFLHEPPKWEEISSAIS